MYQRLNRYINQLRYDDKEFVFMTEQKFDLIVIGAGPGGYTAAIRAAQLGMSVAVVEKRFTLGGVCLNEGCIPSKALLESSRLFAQASDKFELHGISIHPPVLNLDRMMQRKTEVVKKLTDGIEYLFKKYGITRFFGTASLAGQSIEKLYRVIILLNDPSIATAESPSKSNSPTSLFTIHGTKILLATGSEPVEPPGIFFDGNVVVSAREALLFDKIPEHLVVLGGSYIGLEMASLWKRLGAQVTVVEMQPQILSGMDRQVSEVLYRALRKQGIHFRLNSRLRVADISDKRAIVRITCNTDIEEIDCDRLLIAVGRRPFIQEAGITDSGILQDVNGRVIVDSDYQTSLSGVYAVGDLIPGPMLAHKASDEAVTCVERIAGIASAVNYNCIPGIVYTFPEAAYLGKSEEELRESSVSYKTGRYNFSANGRARCMEETEGFVKILVDQETDKILGVHIVCSHASDLIAETAVVMNLGATVRDISSTSHPHPTLSEALKEAALDVYKEAINI